MLTSKPLKGSKRQTVQRRRTKAYHCHRLLLNKRNNISNSANKILILMNKYHRQKIVTIRNVNKSYNNKGIDFFLDFVEKFNFWIFRKKNATKGTFKKWGTFVYNMTRCIRVKVHLSPLDRSLTSCFFLSKCNTSCRFACAQHPAWLLPASSSFSGYYSYTVASTCPLVRAASSRSPTCRNSKRSSMRTRYRQKSIVRRWPIW